MNMSDDQRFRPGERLRLRKDFARAFEVKCSAADAALIVYVADNGLAWSRLGISVSRRIGMATVRNDVRRQLREAFRTNKRELPRGLDIVCVARPKAADRRWDAARSLRTLVHEAARHLTKIVD